MALKVILPKPVGVAGTGLDANHRVFRAASGKPYRIPLCAIGGRFPYARWTTTNGSIVPYTDRWGNTLHMLEVTNPVSNFSYAVTVEDFYGATASSGTINVTVTTAIEYVDGDNVSGGRDGTEANPWNSVAELKTGSLGQAIVMFRDCATPYNTAGLSTSANTGGAYALGEERSEWSSANEGVIWMAYPGETPTLDFAYTGTGYPYDTGDSKPRFRFSGQNIWIEGMTFTRAMTMAFQISRPDRRGAVIWNNRFFDCGPTAFGGNGAFLMWMSLYGGGGTPNTQAYWDIIVNNLFDNDNIVDADMGGPTINRKIAAGPMITYSMIEPLFEGNRFDNFHGQEAHFAQKAEVLLATFRGNRGGSQSDPMAFGFYGGNQDTHNVPTDLTSGDLVFNLCWALVQAFDFGTEKVSTIGWLEARRNTMIGPVRIGNPTSPVVTADGPYTIRDNVIQNSGGTPPPIAFVTDLGITDLTRIDFDNNVTATSGLVDSSGNQLDPTYVGIRGHQRG